MLRRSITQKKCTIVESIPSIIIIRISPILTVSEEIFIIVKGLVSSTLLL